MFVFVLSGIALVVEPDLPASSVQQMSTQSYITSTNYSHFRNKNKTHCGVTGKNLVIFMTMIIKCSIVNYLLFNYDVLM